MVVGPHAPVIWKFDFRFVETGELITFMGRMGVLFLLFYLWLESNVSRLIKAGRSIAIGGGTYPSRLIWPPGPPTTNLIRTPKGEMETEKDDPWCDVSVVEKALLKGSRDHLKRPKCGRGIKILRKTCYLTVLYRVNVNPFSRIMAARCPHRGRRASEDDNPVILRNKLAHLKVVYLFRFRKNVEKLGHGRFSVPDAPEWSILHLGDDKRDVLGEMLDQSGNIPGGKFYVTLLQDLGVRVFVHLHL